MECEHLNTRLTSAERYCQDCGLILYEIEKKSLQFNIHNSCLQLSQKPKHEFLNQYCWNFKKRDELKNLF